MSLSMLAQVQREDLAPQLCPASLPVPPCSLPSDPMGHWQAKIGIELPSSPIRSLWHLQKGWHMPWHTHSAYLETGFYAHRGKILILYALERSGL